MRASLVALVGGLVVASAASSLAPSAAADDATFAERDLAELMAMGAVVEERDTDSAGWHDITVGMMMERTPASESPLTARSLVPPQPNGLQTRDGERTEVVFERDVNGAIRVPRSWEEAKSFAKRGGRRAKHHIKKKVKGSKRFAAIITWYTGGDLLNPACVQKSSWHPTDRSLVTALTIDWPGQPKCGEFIKIKAPKSNKSVIVRHVDACGGCAAGTKHCDLTLRAFTALATISQGKLWNLQAQVVSSPIKRKKWSPADIALYGPQYL